MSNRLKEISRKTKILFRDAGCIKRPLLFKVFNAISHCIILGFLILVVQIIGGGNFPAFTLFEVFPWLFISRLFFRRGCYGKIDAMES